ncbi:hypothetical protein AZSI13_08540 [Azospira sp. I13]|uniref:DUF4845 domain-containing protein n=1 Tax=Azospira sp. I13 TaxID=1765050 RepID=UPI000D4453C9|nr:DUF4845 domain-containing protein [Azospira sp. I13]GBG01527.1 hypothetical protein AZSI13_08540 [Azospira sp. I13]
MSRKPQAGVALSSFLMWVFIVVFGGILGMKVVPAVIEYFTIVKTVKAVAAESPAGGITVGDVRKSFDRRATIDAISSISGADLDVTKDGGNVVISFSYAKKIHLVGPVSLFIDFQGSASGNKGD